jgi:hypothetical protein
MDQLANAELTRQQWEALAQSSPTPWILGMRKVAEENYQRLATQFHAVTPNYEP